MGLKLASTLAITALFGLVYALVFAVGIWFLGDLGIFGLLIMVGITLLIVLFQYGISPVFIKWTYKITWIPFEDYRAQYPHLGDVIDQVVQVRRIKTPKVGIIYGELSPNAFTFGWTKNKARVVLSEGILEYLSEEEQSAVLAHEMGHVVHSDFILMTVVFAIPLVLLTIGRWAFYTARFSSFRSRDDEGSIIYLALFAIAILSYVSYYIGYLISLIVSRIREYYADSHAAEVLENPNALSTGLVKIAYGLLVEPAMITVQQRNRSKMRGLRGLGIFDPNSARGLVVSSIGSSGAYSKEAIQAAAAWDLFNPWAKYYQIFSTHPLPAKRIQRLNNQCDIYGLKPEIDFSKAREIKEEQAGKSMLDEFILDITIKNLALFVFIAMGIFSILWIFGLAGFIGLTILPIVITTQWLVLLWFGTFYLMGFAFLLRMSVQYKKGYEPRTVLDLVTNVKVSPIRCVPAYIEGTIIGRGVAGYYFSDDLYFKDETGILYIDYSFGIRLVDWFFAITKVERLIGQRVRIKGWYRRGPIPYLQVHSIETESGRIFRNYKKQLTYLWAVLLFLIGALLFWVGIFVL
ncbi:MAG: zinc metalloprotease HtpX [Promethearchaeota archaeon]